MRLGFGLANPDPDPNANPNPNPIFHPNPNQAEAEEHHLVHLLHAKGRPMEPGSELTLRTAPPAVARYNDQLLLEAGFLWDDLACASVPLRFQIGVDSMP